jgi:hypothetical protein
MKCLCRGVAPLFLLTLVTLVGACKRPVVLPTTEVKRARLQVVADVPPDREPSPGQTRVLGNGWYANIEIDDEDRLHLAWTDADIGDVMYAVSEPRRPRKLHIEPVEVEGATGSYLRLALGPGATPVLSYYHQDQRTLRLAHRPGDLPRMGEAGAVLEGQGSVRREPSVLVPGEKPPPPPAHGMGPGWHGEEIAFGDNAGIAGSLTVDSKGYPHVIYYTKNERLRYARRPPGYAAFGETVHGAFDKRDIDEKAGGSYTMSTDLIALPDGTIVASYCHWNYVDSQLKIAVQRPGSRDFDVVEASEMLKLIDGWHSSLLPRADGRVDVFSVATGEGQMLLGSFDPASPGPLGERQVVVDRPGASVVRRAKDGTVWVLTRGLGLPSLGEESGVWLIELPAGDAGRAHRYLLEKGIGRDPWIDLALMKDGTPVAVWTSRETLSMRLYVHKT